MLGLKARILLSLTFTLILSCKWVPRPDHRTLVIGLSENAKTLDPLRATDANGQRVLQLIYSTLIRWESQTGLVPDLAQSWTREGLRVRFLIRPRVLFHNGKKLNQEDLRWSIEQFRSPTSFFSAQLENIQDVQVNYEWENGGEIVVVFKEWLSSNLMDLSAIKIMTRPDQETSPQSDSAPNGTGPYRLVRQRQNQILLQRFENYFSKGGLLENLQFQIIRDPSTRALKLYQGEIDLVQGDLPISKIDFFRKLDQFQFFQAPSLDVTYLLINHQQPNLQLKELRRLLRDSLDRNDLLQNRFKGYVALTDQLLPTSLAKWSKPSSQPSSQEKLEIRLQKPLVLSTSNQFEAMENGRWLVRQWRAKGLQVEQQGSDWSHFYQKVRLGQFDLAVMKWVGINQEDFLYSALHSSQTPPGLNRGHYKNPQFDRLVEELRREQNSQRRDQLIKQTQDLLYEDLPIIPLWSPQQVAIVKRTVQGYNLDPAGSFWVLMKVSKRATP